MRYGQNPIRSRYGSREVYYNENGYAGLGCGCVGENAGPVAVNEGYGSPMHAGSGTMPSVPYGIWPFNPDETPKKGLTFGEVVAVVAGAAAAPFTGGLSLLVPAAVILAPGKKEKAEEKEYARKQVEKTHRKVLTAQLAQLGVDVTPQTKTEQLTAVLQTTLKQETPKTDDTITGREAVAILAALGIQTSGPKEARELLAAMQAQGARPQLQAAPAPLSPPAAALPPPAEETTGGLSPWLIGGLALALGAGGVWFATRKSR